MLQIVSGVGLVSFLKVVVEYCGPHGETKKCDNIFEMLGAGIELATCSAGGPFECEDVTKDWSDAQYDDAKHLVDIAAWFITGVICRGDGIVDLLLHDFELGNVDGGIENKRRW